MTPESWPEVPIKDVCLSIIDCVNKTAPVVDYETPYKMIRTTNVKNGVISLKGARFVEKATFEKWTRRSVPQLGDVVLTREAPLGDVGMITTSSEKIFIGQRLMQYRADPEKLDPYFFLYALQAPFMQEQLKAAGSGSTVEHIRVGDAENLKIKLPSLELQKQIGKVLNAYDVIIANNCRRIAILEEMAQSFYREWFVHFRFPDHRQVSFVDSPLGIMPENWKLVSASEAMQINPRTKLPKEGEKLFVPMSGLSEDSMLIGDIQAKAGNSGAKFINGDTLFSRITPCLQNGKIGYVQFLDKANPVGFGSTEFIVLRESKLLTSEYIYLLARSMPFRENAIKSMTGASGRQRVQNACFDSFKLALPPKELVEEFSKLVRPMFRSIHNLTQRNENLKQQRDMLLPKLISGQIQL
ncbi:restriction endonuclease subunit S [Endozoicomonas sp. YOMI1]|uniref:restriction endonuclease subunit S n=1 Tax=Endozoicomonas sp. YOMI1 TaxID=2828739 RepID=UPI002147E43D|nr:restriction endonuclease subunit S [Endozoicomonas sp. YOMI1]